MLNSFVGPVDVSAALVLVVIFTGLGVFAVVSAVLVLNRPAVHAKEAFNLEQMRLQVDVNRTQHKLAQEIELAKIASKATVEMRQIDRHMIDAKTNIDRQSEADARG